MVFNSVTLDGYFTDAGGDMSWAHQGGDDPEWQAFVAGNASGQGRLVFGRKTYEMMAGFWPTPAARRQMPEVADGMNRMPKIVFSRSLETVTWENTRLVKTDPVAEIRRLKQEPGENMVILGSGTIVSLLTDAGLVDEFQMVMTPVVLGAGRTLFEGVKGKRDLALESARPFRNGKVVLTYAAKKASLSGPAAGRGASRPGRDGRRR
jgi:dihydrofolate reductase